MKQRKYNEGAKARENFERTMTALFRVPKDTAKKTEKPQRKEPKKAEREESEK